MLLMTEKREDTGSQAFLGASVGKDFKGEGVYELDEYTTVSASYKDRSYGSSWNDPAKGGEIKYGPGSITVTKFNGANKPVAGTVTATLHWQSADLKEHKTITVSANFKTASLDK